MGFKTWRSAIPESMKVLVDESIKLGKGLVSPSVCWEYHPISSVSGDVIATDRNYAISSEKVRTWMEGCHGLYLCAVTLGPALDEKVTSLSTNGELTRGFLLNAYGAEAAEALMESLNLYLRTYASEQGWQTTKRYSPGYGDWHISAQKHLLAKVGADQIGIKLTDSFLMVPEKSVSAIIGVKSI